MKHRAGIVHLMIALLMAAFMEVPAQESLQLGFVRSVPQSLRLNPAGEVPYTWWMGIPALSSWHVGAVNSGFTFHDVFYRGSDDSLRFDVDAFLDGLKKNNDVSVNLSSEILAFGFHLKQYYLEARVTERFMGSFHYSKDLMTLLFRLNGGFINTTADICGLGVNMSLFHEVSLGASRKINDRWTSGFRLKYLAGVANIYSRKTSLTLFTDESLAYALTFDSDIEINSSFPGIPDHPADSLDFSLDEKRMLRQLDGWKNPGFAVDLGITYRLLDALTLGVSVNDLGFIHWKNNPRSLVSDEKNHAYTFEGIDIEEYFTGDSISLGDKFEDLLDSLSASMGFRTHYKPYVSYLLATFNLTARYSLGKRNHFGLLLRNEVFDRRWKPGLMLNYELEAGKLLALTAGYYLTKRNLYNLALGFSLKLAAFQFYMVTDNALAFYNPGRTKTAGLQFGFNLCFGDRRFKEAP
ncbi:MAG TPA: DUF5723 family protein [Bacteroidales bacterium]|nr:DUF5723 family protein [Bacteroidales bacterium]HSA42298.1 DUF5723 family protein [Bacteroidales bacterium]